MLHEPCAGIGCPVEHVSRVTLKGAPACAPVIRSGFVLGLVTVTCLVAGGWPGVMSTCPKSADCTTDGWRGGWFEPDPSVPVLPDSVPPGPVLPVPVPVPSCPGPVGAVLPTLGDGVRVAAAW